MTCPSRDTLSDLLDGALPMLRAWYLRRHLRHCADCARQWQEEKRLQDSIRAIDAMVTAPAMLRHRVAFIVLAGGGSAPRKYHPSVVGRVTAIVAAGLLVMVLLKQPAVLPVLRPRPAYAQVVDAMRQIKTAHWRETFSTYDTRTSKSNHFELQQTARLNPPALRTEYPGGEHQLRTAKTEGERVRLRNEILLRLTAPATTGKGRNAWHSDRVQVNGQMLLRLTAGMAQGRQLPPEVKLTAPGYRWTLWVNPATLRVVRSLQEYYDGQSHSRTVASDFEYDRPIPSGLLPK